MRRTAIRLLAALLAPALLAAGCGGDAAAEHPDILPAMLAEIRAMPGYELEPATFERYAEESHPAASRTALSPGSDPADPGTYGVYAIEIYRGMLDRAFTEKRTDLADVLTRAYIAAQRSE